jgi:single-strand DNA-binding protein
MAGISKVILIGNLGRDPETRYTPSGAMNVQFTMAVSRRYRDNSGQDQERTNWFRVTAWAKLAETLDNLTQQGYLAKGKQVYVEGRLEAREYTDQNGATRTSLDVSATEFQLLGQRGDSEGGFGGGGQGGGRPSGGRPAGEEPSGGSPNDFDDVPF